MSHMVICVGGVIDVLYCGELFKFAYVLVLREITVHCMIPRNESNG